MESTDVVNIGQLPREHSNMEIVESGFGGTNRRYLVYRKQMYLGGKSYP
jgi:hypothetical protein